VKKYKLHQHKQNVGAERNIGASYFMASVRASVHAKTGKKLSATSYEYVP